MLLKTIYSANILVAGLISLACLTNADHGSASVFGGSYLPHPVMKLVGCLWGAIAILSIFGLFRPEVFAPVLLLQLIYKLSWLLIVAIPAQSNNTPYPKAMAVFFIVWVLVLPFAIPWKTWFAN